MKNIFSVFVIGLFSMIVLTHVNAQSTKPDNPDIFQSSIAVVNGVNIHYYSGGKGELLVLIHGFGESAYMWNRIFPELGKHFFVVAPELRGIGESGQPESGYDKKTMATDIHELVKKLGFKSAYVVGHDIGLMVAYAYAAQYGDEVKKLVLMDAPIPGIEPVWGQKKATAWWFGFFNWKTSDEIIKGKEGEFLNGFWQFSTHIKNSFTPEEKDSFIRAYSVPGAMQRSFEWYRSFPQDSVDNMKFKRHMLRMPVLAMGGAYSSPHISDQIQMVASTVRVNIIEESGHWLVEEQPEHVAQALLQFLQE
jgi:pimeloyl-ACP methyl ester carboxylesterase